MNLEIKNLPKSLVELTFTHEYDELEDFLAKAARRLSQEVEIAGFRKGKAPYDIIKQKFGESAILQEASQDIIKITYVDTIRSKNLEAVGRPEISDNPRQ